MILLSQWYEPEDPSRMAELEKARKANADSGLFKDITYLNGVKSDWKYNDFFDYAATHFYGEVCILANTDIIFDETARIVPEICQKGRILALTRWEDPSSPNMLGHFSGAANMIGRYCFFSGSQDSWCFIAGGLPPLPSRVPMGVPGCDNVIAGWATKSGCEVFNPAMDIKTWHVHESGARSYPGSMQGFFGYPELTTLSVTGRVIGHQWPLRDGKVEWETFNTCRR